jgi:peptide/nickel transport system substrate-binding protein
MVDIIPDNLAALKANTNYTVVEGESLHTWYLSLNCAKPPFDDVRVRQAFAYAINRQAIVDGILLDTGILANNFLPPVTPYYTEDVAQYPYDPAKAKELLAQAGQSNLSLDFYVPESGSGMQQADAMATAIQSDLAQVGVTLTIQKLEWGAYLDKMFQPPQNQDMLMGEMSWISDNGDPDNFLRILLGGDQFPTAGFNSAYFKNADLDAALAQGMASSDDAVRQAAYVKAQQIVMDQVPYIPVDHEKQIVAYDANLKNIKINPRGFFRFQYASIG